MAGSLTRGLGIPDACAARNFTYLARGPWGVSGFVGGCPSGVWCRGLVNCCLYVSPFLSNPGTKQVVGYHSAYWTASCVWRHIRIYFHSYICKNHISIFFSQIMFSWAEYLLLVLYTWLWLFRGILMRGNALICYIRPCYDETRLHQVSVSYKQ